MTRWVLRGLGTGVKTTPYPEEDERADGVTPGRPAAAAVGSGAHESLVARCPTGALTEGPRGIEVDMRRCVHCYRCSRGPDAPLPWRTDYQWASVREGVRPLGRPWARSLHILVVDAGDCGACLREVRQLTSPYYNLHRLGFIITPTPRLADLLLVVWPLQRAYEAMPTPKRVIAVGACALSTGVFGPSPLCRAVAEVLPVDVEVPGSPPPPLAILHGLLVAAGRAPSRGVVG